MTDQRVVLVDGDGRELRASDGSLLTMAKLEAHRRGACHRAVSIFVFDGDRWLLQRRAATKYHSPGLWTNTCCTHPRPGEAPLAAARRRLSEEMGLECELAELFQFLYRATVDPDLVEHEYDHVFVGEWRGTPRPDPNEVAQWRWLETDALRAEVALRPELFTYWMRQCIDEVAARRERR